MPMAALKRSATATSFDPLTLLPALAVVTERLGLIATASTTYNEPYHIARKFASLDHHQRRPRRLEPGHHRQPGRGAEFRAARSMSSMASAIDRGARVLRRRHRPVGQLGRRRLRCDDRRAASFSIPTSCTCSNHKGEHFKVRGPLNIARPVQGWPVIVQAGASEAGRQIAAETAEVVFGSRRHAGRGAQAFYADVKGRMAALGRDPDHLKILPGALVVVGETVEEAQAQEGARSTAWCIPTAASPRCRSRSAPTRPASTSTGRCRRSPRPTPSKSGRQRVIDRARRDEPDRAPAGADRRRLWRAGAWSARRAMIADQMEEWLFSRRAATGST